MNLLKFIISKTGLTPTEFAEKYKFKSIFHLIKKDYYSVNMFEKLINIAKKENIDELNFTSRGYNINIHLQLSENIKQMHVADVEEVK